MQSLMVTIVTGLHIALVIVETGTDVMRSSSALERGFPSGNGVGFHSSSLGMVQSAKYELFEDEASQQLRVIIPQLAVLPRPLGVSTSPSSVGQLTHVTLNSQP